MGATSVTGVGLGSADGSNKGSSHMTLGVSHLIGPRVVACDTVVLDGSGVGSVTLPVLAGDDTGFVVVANDTNVSGAAAVGCSFAMDADGVTLSFNGTAAHTVQYAIIKKGLSL